MGQLTGTIAVLLSARSQDLIAQHFGLLPFHMQYDCLRHQAKIETLQAAVTVQHFCTHILKQADGSLWKLCEVNYVK